MTQSSNTGGGLTPLGKIFSFLLIFALIGVGAYVLVKRGVNNKTSPPPGSGVAGTVNDPKPPMPAARDAGANSNVPALTSVLATEIPSLAAPVPYQMKDNTIDIELSEYPGYAGLIVANGGLDPSEDSVFFKKHGFKVRIAISEDESWSKLNSGGMAASATTADVLAVYGKQFQVVVPAQIGFSRGADGIIVRKDINRINQLKGKVLATSQFTEVEFLIRYLAQEAGLEVNLLPDTATPADPEKINLFFCEDAFEAGDVFLEDLESGANRFAGCVIWESKLSDVARAAGDKARLLTTNRNLLIVADLLIVNKGFAQANPQIVAGLVDGVLTGNRMVRDNPDAYLDVVAKAFNKGKDQVKDKDSWWDRAKAKSQLGMVHFANLPENLAFFSGSIDAAGSFSGIYQSAILAYGNMIRDPVDGDRFPDLQALKALEASGAYKDQKIAIAPVRSGTGTNLETNPLLSKDIRFFFEPNSSRLDMQNAENLKNLDAIKNLLQVSPGSKILLRGHVDNAKIEEFRTKGGEALVQQAALEAVRLSKERAAEIKRLLIERNKVDLARLDTIGRGWQEPAGKDSDKNRRVEVYWYTLE